MYGSPKDSRVLPPVLIDCFAITCLLFVYLSHWLFMRDARSRPNLVLIFIYATFAYEVRHDLTFRYANNLQSYSAWGDPTDLRMFSSKYVGPEVRSQSEPYGLWFQQLILLLLLHYHYMNTHEEMHCVDWIVVTDSFVVSGYLQAEPLRMSSVL